MKQPGGATNCHGTLVIVALLPTFPLESKWLALDWLHVPQAAKRSYPVLGQLASTLKLGSGPEPLWLAGLLDHHVSLPGNPGHFFCVEPQPKS